MKTGVAWYRRKQQNRLLEISTDSDELESTYDEWIEQATNTFNNLAKTGITLKKVNVDVEELLKWCRANNRPVDGEARTEYVVRKMKELDS